MYALTQARYRTLKSRLTRRLNVAEEARREAERRPNRYAGPRAEAAHKAYAHALRQVIQEADNVLAEFHSDGYPDDWARWQRAADDARFSLRFLDD